MQSIPANAAGIARAGPLTTEAEFEAAFSQARAIIASMPGFESLRLLRCLETLHRYLLLVEWERLEDHTEGFGRR